MHKAKLILLSIFFSLSAWQTSANDLLHYYQLALENDAQFKAAKAEFEANQYNVDIAQSAIKPQLSANARAGQARSEVDENITTGDVSSATVSAGLSLYDRTNYLNINQAKLQYEIATLNFDNAKQDLMLRLAEAYLSLLAAEDQHAVAQSQSKAIQSQLDQARQRLDVGLGTRTDLLDAQARYQQAKADLIRSQNLIDINHELIREITGQQDTELAKLISEADVLLDAGDRQQWIDLSQSQNLQVRIATISEKIAELEVKKQGAQRLPNLRLDGEHTRSFETLQGDDDSETSSINLSLNLPIYQGGAIRAQKKQALANLNSTKELLEQARREAKTTTSSAFLTLQSSQEQISALKQAVEAGKNALKARSESFRAGLGTNIDVLNAQRDLAESERQLSQARYDLLLQRLQLERAAGTLSEESLTLINALFNDEAKSTTEKTKQN